MVVKECRTCGTLKPLEEFHKNSKQRDGRTVWCRSCVSEYGRQRYLRKRDEIRAQAKTRYLDNPDVAKERVRAWRASNGERHRAWNRQWREKHLEQISESGKRYMADPENRRRKAERESLRRSLPEVRARRAFLNRVYRQKNRTKRAEAEQRRRAQKLETVVEILDPDRIWTLSRGICHICGEPARQDKWELDHCIPLSRGGHHTYENVLVSHSHCNRTKHARLKTELRPEELKRLVARSREAA